MAIKERTLSKFFCFCHTWLGMRVRIPEKAIASAHSLLGRSTWLILALAGLLTVTWLWSCWCSFPSIPWNDIRVAPAVALHHGISIYSVAGAGPVSTWVYGPMPMLLLWPAGLASSAIGAMETAGAIHIGLTVLTFALTCAFWPVPPGPEAKSQDKQRRLAAAILCVLLVRNDAAGYIVYNADAPGVVFGLLALLAMSRRLDWAAAVCAVSAMACKQTLLGVALAQFIWLFLTVSPRAAWQQLGRCVVVGALFAVAAVAYFGWSGLWHTMIEIPSRFPWAAIPGRLTYHTSYLLLHIGLPILVMVIWRRFFFSRNSPVLLPALAFFCTLPLSFAGFLKIGGNVNSLHSFWLWFPPTLVALVSGRSYARFSASGCLALAILAGIIASTWIQFSTLRVRPNDQAYHEAAFLARRLPGKIWFPMHPIITLYSDGRFYHDFDGLGERVLADQRLTNEQYFAHMPPDRQITATLLPFGWGPADPAEARLPPGTPVSTFGFWRLEGTFDERVLR